MWLPALLTPTPVGSKWPISFRGFFTRGEADICTDCAGSLVGTRANPDVCGRGKPLSPVGNGATIFDRSVRSLVRLRYVGSYVVRVCMICTAHPILFG